MSETIETIEITAGPFHLRLPLCVESIEAAEAALKAIGKWIEELKVKDSKDTVGSGSYYNYSCGGWVGRVQ